MKKKIKSITFSNLIILLGIFQLLAQCQTNFIKAKNKNCLSPGANYYVLKALAHNKISRHNQYHSPKGVFNFAEAAFAKELDLEDRCEQTIMLIKVLNNANDGDVRSWSKPVKETSAKIVLKKTYPGPSNQSGYQSHVCRDFIEIISIKKNIKSFHFTACNYKDFWGVQDSRGNFVEPFVNLDKWNIYETKYFNR